MSDSQQPTSAREAARLDLLQNAAQRLSQAMYKRKENRDAFFDEHEIGDGYNPAPNCPCCFSRIIKVVGVNDILLQDRFQQIHEQGESVRTLPVVVAVCDDCGYVMNFSAKKIRLIR